MLVAWTCIFGGVLTCMFGVWACILDAWTWVFRTLVLGESYINVAKQH